MSNRHPAKARRGAAALALAAVLILSSAACGGGDDKSDPAHPPNSGAHKTAKSGNPESQPDTGQVLATIKGPDGIMFTIGSAQRDSGGFVTVSGQIKNTGSENFTATSAWRGNEEEIIKNGDSLGGATLIDKAGKKRYYVLRDTEGRPLATTSLYSIGAGKSVPFFAQFPAPPAGVDKVDFQVPGLPTTTIRISG